MKSVYKDYQNDKIVQYIVALAQQLIDPGKVIFFGSRATGRHHRLSDYDFAFEDHQKARWSQFVLTVDDQAPTLLKIDLVSLDKPLSPDFEKQIRAEGLVIYERHKK